MAKIERRITSTIKQDIAKKMVLLAGPRQCGKTTLIRHIHENTNNVQFLNWDIKSDRIKIQKQDFDFSKKMWAFDEIHKMSRWKNYLKGIYDEFHLKHSLLVTGSAKLETFSKSGDSLQGRYYLHHLHPFTLSEIESIQDLNFNSPPSLDFKIKKSYRSTIKELLILGGFPEPFLSGSEKEARRWRIAYESRLIEDEIRSLENLQFLDKMALLFDQLPSGAGQLLSINSLREDLEVNFDTVRNWLKILEKFYAIWRIAPYGPPKIKALKKETKLYLWDWSRVQNLGARIENLLALHLLRWCQWLEDTEGYKMEIRYFRAKLGHEVDFVILKDKKPWIAIECKESDSQLSPALRYLLERDSIPYAYQLVWNLDSGKELAPIKNTNVFLMPMVQFLAQLP